MKIVIIGGGIAGLGLALGLHQQGMACEVFEAVSTVKEIGVGITLLPHAMRELAALGVQAELEAAGIENLESVFFNRHGQHIYAEPRGRYAGYPVPEIGMHRGKLHQVLYRAVLQRLGPGALHLDHRCTGVTQSAQGAMVHLASPTTGQPWPSVDCDVVIACDGVNSTVRRVFYPHERMAYAGINTWRGVTVHPPFLTGRSYVRIGSIETGKMVIYPIADNVDGQGRQLINWVAEIQRQDAPMNDWNRRGRAEDFVDIFKDWRFDWLDVPDLIRNAQQILEYPMVDKDPVAQWSFGRVTLMGDAAHPMYPRGSNGAAQALIDARCLVTALRACPEDPVAALQAYQAERLKPTAKIVHTNRSTPPDFIIMKVDELSGGMPFRHIDDLISQAELKAISDRYQDVAGFSPQALNAEKA